MKRSLRVIYFSGLALVWAVVVLLGVEVFERARSLFSERFYASYFQQQNSKVYRMVPLEELEQESKSFSLGEAERAAFSSAQPMPANIVSGADCGGDVAAIEAARDSFAALNTDSRDLITTVRRELRAVMTPSLELVEAYGDPLFKSRFEVWCASRGGVHFHDTLREAMTKLKPGESTGWLPNTLDGRYTLSAEATHVKGHYPNPDHIAVTVRQVPPVLLSPDPPLESSRSTDIPSVRYKKNWFVEGEIASYNNYGFRDDDVVMPKPAGLYRIVCIGGSTTEEGNNNRETYPNQMERKLQAVFGKERIEVINCGISGITSYNELRRIDDYLELDPDLIVYYNGVNDACHEHMGPWLAEVRGNARMLLYSKVLTRLFNRSLLPSDDYIQKYMRETTFRNMRAMAYRAKECGVKFAICSFAYPSLDELGMRDRIFLDMNFREVYHGQYLTYPTYTHVMDLHNALVREVCASDGLSYIPVAEQLHAGTDHFFDLCHMTPIGLELKSTIISEYVRSIVEPALKGG